MELTSKLICLCLIVMWCALLAHSAQISFTNTKPFEYQQLKESKNVQSKEPDFNIIDFWNFFN